MFTFHIDAIRSKLVLRSNASAFSLTVSVETLLFALYKLQRIAQDCPAEIFLFNGEYMKFLIPLSVLK